MISTFIDILKATGLQHPSWEDIADILWLAEQLDHYSKEDTTADSPGVSKELHSALSDLTQGKSSSKEDEKKSFEQERADIYSDSPGADEKDDFFIHAIDGIPLHVAGGSALPGKLSLARSLRPLMMKVPSRTFFTLHEAETAERVAELNRWDPVLYPDDSRWLDVVLVIDESPTMAIWRDTILEFKELLERQGAFSNVQIKSLKYNKKDDELELYSGINTSISVPINPNELVDPTNRRLIVIVSDCVSSYWHEGLIYQMTEEWTLKNRVALLQMLPYDLWNRTGLKRYDQVYLKNTNPHYANCRFFVEKTSIELELEELSFPNTPEEKRDEAVQKIPIITLESRSLLPWAKMLTGRGGVSIPGVLLQHPDNLIYEDEDNSDRKGDSKVDPITVFRATASPAAQKLARYLAAVPLTLPIMRLVQRVLLPETQQLHLAEVLLSKLVKPNAEKTENLFENPIDIQYEFVGGIRNKLLRDNYLSETVSIMDTVFRELSVFIDKNTGKPISFQAIVGNPLLLDNISVDENKQAFASISVEVLSGLGGKYTQLSQKIKSYFTKNSPIG
ncbi:hypothetical protein KKHLCK_06580 [Candidatus Electrothrix laxa]